MNKVYSLVLMPLASNVPGDVRLQSALKVLLRQFGFRCKSVVPIELKDKQAAKKAVKKKRLGPRGPIEARGAAARSESGVITLPAGTLLTSEGLIYGAPHSNKRR